MSGAGSAEIVRITLAYSGVATVFLIFETAAVRFFRRNRPKKSGDGIFVSHPWGKRLRAVVTCLVMIFMVLPILFFLLAFGFGGILAAIEGWSFDVGSEYAVCNMLGISGAVSASPSSAAGKIADTIVSTFTMLMSASVLGISAGLSLTTQWMSTIVPTVGGLARAMLLYIPMMMFLIAVLTGACMSAIEGWSFAAGFYFMVGALCGIQTPLTTVTPSSPAGNFFAALCTLIELLLGGAIVGVIGGHPCMATLMDFVQGVDEDPVDDAVAETKSPVPSSPPQPA